MQFFLLGLALLVLVLLVGRALANADPKVLARSIRKIGGYGAIAAVMFGGGSLASAMALPLLRRSRRVIHSS